MLRFNPTTVGILHAKAAKSGAGKNLKAKDFKRELKLTAKGETEAAPLESGNQESRLCMQLALICNSISLVEYGLAK